MKIKSISLAILLLSLGALVIASEYEAPKIDLKEKTPSQVVTAPVEFSDHNRIETKVEADRQIASEPAEEKQHLEPWNYRTNNRDSAH